MGGFAMKLVRLLFLMGFLGAVWPAAAQENAALYRLTDISVDVSAASAAKARDEAIPQAQKKAFEQLLIRLGAGASVAVSDDDVAQMVWAFEVQKEHAGGTRYMGTFAVQFKPAAVKQFLYQKNVSYTEERAQPVVVLPISYHQGHPCLWEDRTPWRNVWEEVATKGTLVPVIVPAGDLNDISLVSTEEALAGRPERLRSLMQKYSAGGVMVAALQAEPGREALEGHIAVYPYDSEGTARDAFEFDLTPVEKPEEFDNALKEIVRKILGQMETDWRQAHAQTLPPSNASAPIAPPAGFQVFLPVDVPVPDLASWAQIRDHLRRISLVEGTHVISMTRGLVHIELQFHGDIASLQAAMTERGLRLEQNAHGGWQIRPNGGSKAL